MNKLYIMFNHTKSSNGVDTENRPVICCNDLKVAQINLLHCKKATNALCRDLRVEQTNITIIQEPWIRGNKVHGFGQLHDRLFYHRKGTRPRAALHVSKDIDAMILNQFSDDDLVAVRVCRGPCEGGDFVVASAYLPYDSPRAPPGPFFARLVDYCRESGLELLVGMDANSHHTVWGSSDVNLRGEELLQYIMMTDFLVLNRGKRPTFANAIREEVLDVSLATCGLESRVHSWRVSEQETFSDHKLIKFRVAGYAPLRQPYRNPRKTDWDIFRTELSRMTGALGEIERLCTAEEVDVANDRLTSSLIAAYEAACPLIRPKPLYGKPLWSDDLEDKKRKARKAWNVARRTGRDEDFVSFRALQKEYKEGQEALERKAKKKFYKEIDSIPAYARIHKILAKDPGAQVGSLTKRDGSFTTNGKETAEVLLQTHFPECLQVASVRPDRPEYQPSRRDWKFAERLVKKGKIKWAVHKFFSFKSPGPDGVFPALLKQGLDVIMRELMNIFTSSVALGYIPKMWEKVRVAFIPKPGRTTHSEVKDFRPISLASFLLKTLERLFDFYLRGDVLKRVPLHANQHAYQVGKSTDTALHQLTQRIEKMLGTGKIALGCFLDVEGAFDNTDFEVIAQALRERQTEGVATRWIVAMLKNRRVEATVCGERVEMQVTRGCPQGGILSPILWCMVVDSLLNRLNRAGFYAQGYSDDVSILICGDFEGTVGDLLRTAVKIVEEWCIEHRLRVNPVKTEIVLFSKRRVERRELVGNFLIFEREVPLTSCVRYLGVIFDCRMTWIVHLSDKIKKAIGVFWMCRSALGKSWGLSPRAVWWIFTAVVRPMLCHGCVVWWPRVELATACGALGKLQRLAGLCITGAMASTPTRALEAILSLPPLDMYIKSEAFNASENIVDNGWWAGEETFGHSKIRTLIKEPELDMPKDVMKTELMLEDIFECIIPSREDWLCEKPKWPPRVGTVCYTDGSKDDFLSGLGYYCESMDVKNCMSTGQYASIFQTEVFAISEISTSAPLQGEIGKHIYICTDSESAIKAIQSPMVKSRMVQECKTTLNNLAARNKVTLLWVPGHSGIDGNEEADRLARQGASEMFIGPEPRFGLPKSTIKSIVRKWLSRSHREIWNSCAEGKHTKYFCKNPSEEKSESILALKRSDIKRLVDVMTNHCNLNKHLHTMSYVDNPMCGCGLEEETGLHLVTSCQKYRALRVRIFGHPVIPVSKLPELDIQNLAYFIKRTMRLS